jgi:hypothetical protein
MNYSLSNMLGRASSNPIVVTGFAYPMETLTASRAGQWYIDGSPVSGQTGATFQVPLLAYGKVVTCGSSAPATVWKPWDIAGVFSVRIADRSVFNAVSPNVAATDGQTVRRWNGLVSSAEANQATAANQPIWREAGQSGNPSVEFDGANDFVSSTNSTEINSFNNVASGYMIVGCRDTNPTGGQATHAAAVHELVGVSGASNTRISLTTRISGNNWRAFAFQQTSLTSTTLVANNSNYNVHTVEALFSSGTLNHRVNASQIGTASFPASANSSSNNSTAFSIGALSTFATTTGFPGHICCVISCNQLLSATNCSRLERFAGLFGGLNIPLV